MNSNNKNLETEHVYVWLFKLNDRILKLLEWIDNIWPIMGSPKNIPQQQAIRKASERIYDYKWVGK